MRIDVAAAYDGISPGLLQAAVKAQRFPAPVQVTVGRKISTRDLTREPDERTVPDEDRPYRIRSVSGIAHSVATVRLKYLHTFRARHGTFAYYTLLTR
jgi:hypothetical protein